MTNIKGSLSRIEAALFALNARGGLVFKINDRITMTEKGLKTFPVRIRSKQINGTVVGFSHNKKLIRVKRDGLKTITTFHPSFWTKILKSIVGEG